MGLARLRDGTSQWYCWEMEVAGGWSREDSKRERYDEEYDQSKTVLPSQNLAEYGQELEDC